MAWKIVETNGSYNTSGEANTLLVTICCDDVGDLPSASQTGYKIGMGSIADIISNGDRYKMKSNGMWVLQPRNDININIPDYDQLEDAVEQLQDDVSDVQGDIITLQATDVTLNNNKMDANFVPETSSPSLTNNLRIRFAAPRSSNELTILVGKLNSTTNYVQFYVNGVDKGYLTFDVSRNIDVWST